MKDRIALDSNVVIQMFRDPVGQIPPQTAGRTVVLPLPVVGELFAGAYSSAQRERNLEVTETFVESHAVVSPDEATARLYGRLRAEYRQALTTAKLNDLWIAALCIQHRLPLLTNDRGFTAIPGLTVINW